MPAPRHDDTPEWPGTRPFWGGVPLAIVTGVALQLQQASLWPAWVYALFMAPALIHCAWAAIKKRAKSSPTRRRLAAWRVPAAMLVVAAGWLLWVLLGLGYAGLRAGALEQQTLSPALEGRDLALTGTVAAMPQRSADGSLRFRLEVESARLEGSDEPVAVPPLIYLGWYGGVVTSAAGSEMSAESSRLPADLAAGERWQLTARLKAPHGGLNPGGFDYELWLWEQGLQATGYVRAGPKDLPPVRLAGTWRHPVESARQSVRDAILGHVEDRALAGIVAALVTGDQAAIERNDWDIFRATGVAHLMSISGLHVTMFAWLAGAIAGALWRRHPRLCLLCPAQHLALVAGLAFATVYALFSGWGVPAQRTVLMLATVGLLRLGGRTWPWPPVWMLACLVVTLLDPWALLQAGFWLSFVAVGILFATDSGAAHAHQTGAAGRFHSMIQKAMALLREQWVVTMALTPLSLLLFGQVSTVGLPANLLAIPWVTLVVTPLAMGGMVWAPLWDAAALALAGLGVFLQWLASWPGATWSLPTAPWWVAAAGVLGGALLVMRLPWAVRSLGLVLLVPVLAWQPARPGTGQFELLAADIGQGNAVLVRTRGHSLLFDAGPRYGSESDAGHRVLVPLLRTLGEKLDLLVLSHRDIDHTGGAPALLAMQPGAGLLSSLEDGHPLSQLRPGQRCHAASEGGQAWDWDGVHFEILQPQRADYDAAQKSNAMSCVLRISNGRQTALLTGDIEQPQEARLVEWARTGAASLKADVLLVPHHGSKTSSSAAFLDAVHPQLALVQAGYRNRFGHPAAPVIQRYIERDIRVMDSARCGAMRWRSDDPAQITCQRELSRRYWHHRLP